MEPIRNDTDKHLGGCQQGPLKNKYEVNRNNKMDIGNIKEDWIGRKYCMR